MLYIYIHRTIYALYMVRTHSDIKIQGYLKIIQDCFNNMCTFKRSKLS